MGYINNENPYAYCTDYHKNSINMQERKGRLTALQRIQPKKVCFRMIVAEVRNERMYIQNYAVETEKKKLIKKGLAILGVEYHDFPEALFEKHLENEEVLEIALRIKKLNLFQQQKKLRNRVFKAMKKKCEERNQRRKEISVPRKGVLVVDNVKDALLYCKLEEKYEESIIN